MTTATAPVLCSWCDAPAVHNLTSPTEQACTVHYAEFSTDPEWAALDRPALTAAPSTSPVREVRRVAVWYAHTEEDWTTVTNAAYAAVSEAVGDYDVRPLECVGTCHEHAGVCTVWQVFGHDAYAATLSAYVVIHDARTY